MGRHDWYRNTDWSSGIEAAFRAKLGRARDKRQYLRIQALSVTKCRPDVALALLDEYFALPAMHDRAQAWCDRAGAYLALNRIEDAIAAYRQALHREAEFPKSLTGAYLALPELIVSKKIVLQYDLAIEILENHAKRPIFPVERFLWHALQAILSIRTDNPSRARDHAHAALAAAAERTSGFRYHADLGLVTEKHADIVDQLHAIVS